MRIPPGSKIQRALESLLVARSNRPIGESDAVDELVDRLALDPVLKGGSVTSSFGLEVRKARGNLVKAGRINQFPSDEWSLTDEAYAELERGHTYNAHRT